MQQPEVYPCLMWEASRIVLDRYSIIPRAQARGIDFSFPDWKEMALLELFLAFSGSDFRIKIPERSVVTVFCAYIWLF